MLVATIKVSNNTASECNIYHTTITNIKRAAKRKQSKSERDTQTHLPNLYPSAEENIHFALTLNPFPIILSYLQ